MPELEYLELIGPVARALLGEPNEHLSKPTELRFGTHGSVAVDLDKGTFFDHETNEGGGLLDLVRCKEGSTRTRADAVKWLEREGFVQADGGFSTSANLKPQTTAQQQHAPTVVATYDYCDEGGALVFQVLRYEPKTFRQRRPEGSGWSWSVKGVRVLPYRLPEMLADPAATVFVVEGEKDADRLAALGLVATCNAGGAGKWKKEHREFLRARRVVVLPDNDTAGEKHAQQVERSLRGIAAEVRTLVLPGLPDKGDVSDWLDAGGTVDELLALASADTTTSAASQNEDDADAAGSKDSLSSLLVAFVLERCELFHDESGDAFAMVASAQETYRLTSTKFKSWLMAAFYRHTGKAARDQSVREAMQVLDGMARHEGEQKAVHIRVAQVDGAIFVDLAQPGSSMAAKIEAGRWTLVQSHPVRFLRPDTMRPLPVPGERCDIAQLWNFVNVPEDARLLVLAWLLECLRPATVFPVLELLGEAGSAKSTTQRYLRMLVDPNASNLRSPPKSVEDVFVSAGLNWVVSFENVSHLTPPMQDALCVLATGGGYAKRKLYSDEEESVINVTRPVVLNGISACVTAHDLIDRSVCVEPQRLQTRREDGDIQREFDAAYPALVGALFELMAQTLQELPNTHLPESENIRMTGFARLGMAMARALGQPQSEFLRQFHASRQESIARTIDSSPVATALLEWFESRLSQPIDLPAKTLLTEVERFKPMGAEAWPKTAKGFGDALRRAAPSLRYVGVEVKSLGKVGGTVKWAIRSCGSAGQLPTPSPECPASPGQSLTSAAFAENLGKNTPKTGHEQDIRTFRTLSHEFSSPSADHIEESF